MKEIFICISKGCIESLDSGDIKKFPTKSGSTIYYNSGYECDKYIILFSGEIYNSAKEDSVYQYIQNSYEKNWTDFLAETDGAFSVILFDKQKEALFGAVDKFGIKSLYYCVDTEKISLSNRIKSFYLYKIIDKKPNFKKNFLFVGSHYRHIDTVPEETFYLNVYRITQHAYAKYQNESFEINSYWDLELLDLSKKTEDELKKEYLDLLRESTRLRLASSSNPAFMVSSGMDSSSVAALASEILGKKVTIFTTVFEEDTEYNEAEDIESLAHMIAKEWHRLAIDPLSIEQTMLDVLNAADEPFYTVTQLMHYYLSKEAANLGFDALFGGLGGDEANCGEIEEYLFYFADLKYRGKEDRLRADVDGWVKYHGTTLYPKSYEMAHQFFDNHIDFGCEGKNFLDSDRFHRYMGVFKENFYKANSITPVLSCPYKSYLRNKLYQDLFSEIIPCVLRAEDFNLSEFGLSAKMPYLNDKVMQYGFSIPIEYKYKNGCNKAILRESMRGIMPDEIVENCVKKGWNAPFGNWIKNFLKDNIERMIDSPTQRQVEIYNLDVVKVLLMEHLCEKTNHMMFFWQFLNYELWYEIHFK